jgi:dihydrofolate synthase/folylpolyglutamate synthase
MCTAVLAASGYRVGLYTSPHLRDFRERIRVVSSEDPEGHISKGDFVTIMEEVQHQLDVVPGVTWFEIVTAVAFRHFAKEKVDIAVVEVGLGGRLDATNVLVPLVSVITSLSLDHTYLLGDTLEQIATEKGGIIKPGVPVVIAPQAEESLTRLEEIAAERGSPISVIGRNWRYKGVSQQLVITRSADEQFIPACTPFDLALAGEHQLENATVALAILHSVREHVPGITLSTMREGLADVRWDGRLQTVYEANGRPTLLVDSAHNEDSAIKLKAALTHVYEYERLWLIFGAPGDKAIAQMIALLFPMAHQVFVATADHPRAASPAQLAELASALGFETTLCESAGEALREAFQLADPGDLICATGSIIFVGDLLNQWDSLKSQLIVH